MCTLLYLYHFSVYCTELYSIKFSELYCTVQQCLFYCISQQFLLYCTVMFTVLYCTVHEYFLHFTVLHCTVIFTVLYSNFYCTVQYSTAMFSVQYCTVLTSYNQCTVLYCAALFNLVYLLYNIKFSMRYRIVHQCLLYFFLNSNFHCTILYRKAMLTALFCNLHYSNYCSCSVLYYISTIQ